MSKTYQEQGRSARQKNGPSYPAAQEACLRLLQSVTVFKVLDTQRQWKDTDRSEKRVVMEKYLPPKHLLVKNRNIEKSLKCG